jgi:hypothetical protein
MTTVRIIDRDEPGGDRLTRAPLPVATKCQDVILRPERSCPRPITTLVLVEHTYRGARNCFFVERCTLHANMMVRLGGWPDDLGTEYEVIGTVALPRPSTPRARPTHGRTSPSRTPARTIR